MTNPYSSIQLAVLQMEEAVDCGPARENPGDSNNSDQFTEKHYLQENHTRMGLDLSRKKKKEKKES